MMDPAAAFLASHRAHDVAHLHSRWRKLARSLRLPFPTVAEADGYPIPLLVSGVGSDGLYLTTGIHGDEVGATEGLLRWAEQGGLAAIQRRKIPFLLAPCLNPWGVANNRRSDSRGEDLNRRFSHDWPSPMLELRDTIAQQTFRLAVTLHEDYDARGLYLYEVRGPRPYWGERLMACVQDIMPADGRREIEGRAARGGVVRPRLDARTQEFLKLGCPEALWLRFSGKAERIFTFETPSEAELERRAETHARLLAEAIRLAFG